MLIARFALHLQRACLLATVGCMVVAMLPATASAGTVSKGNTKKVTASTENDGYNPASDPLPEWLILPEGLDENSLQYQGDPATSQTITGPAAEGTWEIVNNKDGKTVTYKYLEAGALQYSLKTTGEYTKVTLYNEHGKKLKTVTSDIFFDEAIDIESYGKKSTTATASRMCVSSKKCYPPGGKTQKARKNTKLSDRQLKKLLHKAGFRGEGKKMGMAIIKAESRGRVGEVLCNTSEPFNPQQKFEAGVKRCKKSNASADRGLFQINNRWHKNVSNKCSFSPRCNTKNAYRISSGGKDWSPWSTYQNGSYQQHYGGVFVNQQTQEAAKKFNSNKKTSKSTKSQTAQALTTATVNGTLTKTAFDGKLTTAQVAYTIHGVNCNDIKTSHKWNRYKKNTFAGKKAYKAGTGTALNVSGKFTFTPAADHCTINGTIYAGKAFTQTKHKGNEIQDELTIKAGGKTKTYKTNRISVGE